jgi:hypothetical protein
VGASPGPAICRQSMIVGRGGRTEFARIAQLEVFRGLHDPGDNDRYGPNYFLAVLGAATGLTALIFVIA